MSKFLKVLAASALVAGTLAVSSSPAMARWHGHGGWHHGGGWGWGAGAFGLGLGLGLASPYYGYGYGYGPGYYDDGACGWVPVRYRRHGYWHVRRVWRCW